MKWSWPRETGGDQSPKKKGVASTKAFGRTEVGKLANCKGLGPGTIVSRQEGRGGWEHLCTAFQALGKNSEFISRDQALAY